MFRLIILTFFALFNVSSAYFDDVEYAKYELAIQRLNFMVSTSMQNFISQFNPDNDDSWFEEFINEKKNCWYNCKNPICKDQKVRDAVTLRCIIFKSMFPDDWEKRL